MEKGEKRGIKLIGDALNRINDRTGDFKGKILLETTAGQGTNLGYNESSNIILQFYMV